VNLLDWAMVLFMIGALIYWMYQYEFLIDQLGWEPPLLITVIGAGDPHRPRGGAADHGADHPGHLPALPGLRLRGALLPGLLRHDGFPLWRIIEYNFVTTEGMLGQITNIFASYIFVFVIFAAFLERSGLGELFMDTALAVTGRMTGGPGLAACFSSALMGWSPAARGQRGDHRRLHDPADEARRLQARVRRRGGGGGLYGRPVHAPHHGGGGLHAGRVHRDALHRGGQDQHPAAILYFGAVGAMVYLEARKTNLVGLPRNELPLISSVVKRSYQFLPVPVIIVLMLQGYSPFYSAVWAILVTVVLSWFRKENRMGPKEVFDALVGGVKSSLSVGSLVGHWA